MEENVSHRSEDGVWDPDYVASKAVTVALIQMTSEVDGSPEAKVLMRTTEGGCNEFR